MSIRVYICDDHKIFREGLRSLLEKEMDIEVIGEAGDGITAMREIQRLPAHVVVMDVSMPNLNGIEATRQILNRNPLMKVIALSIHSDRRFISRMMKAGASGYVLKDCAFKELAQAIRAALSGKVYLCAATYDAVIKDYVSLLEQSDISVYSTLSPREREVTQLIAEGKSTKDISVQLCVSVKTIETHRQQIMRKLNVHSVAELTKYAIKEGLTSL
jgi:DNA-binding NarL/FixJ family response regulator